MSPASCGLTIPYALGKTFPVNVNQRIAPPNRFDSCLNEDYALWAWINAHGGLKAICPGMKYATPPWVKMPMQGRRFSPIFDLPLPAADGLEHLVGSFRVPLGYDGAGISVVFNYTGQGFLEGSGDLTWRLQLNQHYVKDYSNVQNQIGSLTTPYYQNSGPILLLSDQLVQFWINRSVGSAGNLNGGNIVASLWGWYYPR